MSVLVEPSPNVHKNVATPSARRSGFDELENKNVAGAEAVVVDTKKFADIRGLKYATNGTPPPPVCPADCPTAVAFEIGGELCGNEAFFAS